MLLLLFLIGSVWSLDQAPGALQSALSNPKLFSSLFNRFTLEQDRHYVGAGEKRLRAGLFRNTLKKVAAHNSEEGISWSMELNMFSDMTEEEKMSYTGLNITEMMTGMDVEELDLSSSNVGNPASKDWRGTAVTAVKNQGGCGSCWIFSGVGALEGHYKTQGSILKSFSEQEGLDCIMRNGCGGGYMAKVFDWLKESGRIATAKAVPYKGRQGRCSYSSTPNALIAFRVTGYTNTRGDGNHETALATSGPLSVGYQVANDFMSYKGGIYKRGHCSGGGHAVTSVGYTSEYFRMKNSWGGRWGESGYFRIARGNVCGITNMGFAPKFRSTGKTDDGQDEGGDDDNNDGGDDTDCTATDKNSRCAEWAGRSPSECVGNSWSYMKRNCAKSCKQCQCTDLSSKCARWERSGYCKRNSGFMNFACKKSCGTCTDDGNNGGPCQEGFKECPDGRCVHQHWNC